MSSVNESIAKMIDERADGLESFVESFGGVLSANTRQDMLQAVYSMRVDAKRLRRRSS